jgi:Flp pilus assembly protein CpaB
MRAHERRPLPRPSARLRPGLLLRRRPRLGALITGIVAVGAGLAVASVVASAEAERTAWGSTRPVVVARRDLEPGAELRGRDVTVQQRPAAAVPDGALRALPPDAVVHHAVFAGEELLDDHLAPAGSTGLAALVDDRSRAIAIPIEPGTTPPVEPGQAVDVVAVLPGDDTGGEVAYVVAAGATVLHVDDGAVTVAVSRADAPRVATALATGLVVLTLVGAGA